MTDAIQARLTTIRDMVKRARNLNQQAIAYRNRNGAGAHGYSVAKARSRQFMDVARTLASIAL